MSLIEAIPRRKSFWSSSSVSTVWATAPPFKALYSVHLYPENLRNSMKATFFKFWRFFQGFWVCFGTAAFDTDTVQHALSYQEEGHLILYIQWHDYFVCRVNRFRVMIDSVRDLNKFQILWIRVSCSALKGDYLSAWYFSITDSNKRSVFLLTDHFVIDECKLCNKEWKSLAMV